jgi:glycosyltransferase involved in cell wall biosynthesis
MAVALLMNLKSSENPLVTVVIATKNESKNIGRILNDLSMQTYQKIELIVVDNGSIDNTRKLAEKYLPIKDIFDLKDHIDLTNVKNFRGAQVNLGVLKSHGEIIFFPDADMTFDNDLIAEAVNKIKKYHALYVPEIVVGRGYFGKVRNFERSFYNSTCIDAVRFVKKELFDLTGGFDENNIPFGPDDWDFTKTLKLKNCILGITEKPLYHHEEQLSLFVYLNKKKNYIHTFDDYISKWGFEDQDIKKQFSWYYRFLLVFLENKKWIKVFLRIDLFFALLIIKIYIGILFFISKYRFKAYKT